MADLASTNAAAAAAQTSRIIGPTILMGDGLYFDFAAPDATGMTIADYAWGLASANRFRGQTRDYVGRRVLYNVCQHVVLIAEQMLMDGHPREAAYQGLMHESDEVVWGDLPGPAKLLMPAEMRALIKRSGDAIDAWFGVGHDHKDLVKQYDIRMLATEKRDLMPHASGDQWTFTHGYEPFKHRITYPWSPFHAVERFLDMHNQLKGKSDVQS